MTYLSDHLAAARINRLKARIAEHWRKAHCRCPVCTAARTGESASEDGLHMLLRALGGAIVPDPEAHDATPPADAKKH